MKEEAIFHVMSIYVLHLTRLSDRLLSSDVRYVTMWHGNVFIIKLMGNKKFHAHLLHEHRNIARALGPAFVGGFGKALGGPAVIAAALAVAAVSCTLTL